MVARLTRLAGGARRWTLLACAVVAFVGAALVATRGLASDPRPSGDVVQVRFGGDARNTRIVIELSRSAAGQIVDTGDAPRLLLALPGVSVGRDLDGPGVGLVRRYSLDGVAGAARLRLELTRPAEVRRRFLLPPGDGISVYRYVIDLEAPGAGTAPAPRDPVVEAPPPERVERRARRPVVVIDPGHGGRDPGASNGEAREADVTLAAALVLRERLQRNGRYQVVLTRDDDTYVPLNQRVRIARQADADLFISLHADAGPNPETRGASVYTLSDQGAERAARTVLGNHADYADLDLPARDPVVRRVLLDLTQRANTNRSIVFAQGLMQRVGREAPLLSRSHRHENFAVLLAPDVPAVLLEMGFMTNAEDARALTDRRARARLMDAVAEAIEAYFDAEPANAGGQVLAAAP